MANSNTLTNAIPQILAQGLLALRKRVVMPRLVNNSYSNEAREKGDTVDVPIPSAIAVNAVSPSYVPPDDAGVVPTKVQIPLSNWYEAPFFMTDKDLKDAQMGYLPTQASEAIKALSEQVNGDIFALYKDVYGYVGTAGTTPFASDTGAATAARKVLNEQQADMEPRYFVLDADAEANALGLRAFQDASFRGDADGIIDGMIGRKLGFFFAYDQQVPTHTLAAAGTALVDDSGAVAVGVTTIHMDGFTTKPAVGDVFTIAGDTQTYVVTASTTLAGTDSDVSFQPPLQVALPTGDNNEPVTFKATHVSNLAFHRDAFAFATRPLLDIESMEMLGAGLAMIRSAVDPVSGLTLRLEVTRQHKRWRWAFDILYGVGTVRRELATRVAG